MSRQMLTGRELGQLLRVSDSKGYEYIREMNKELQSKGFMICRGKVPAAYVQERFFGVVVNES